MMTSAGANMASRAVVCLAQLVGYEATTLSLLIL